MSKIRFKIEDLHKDDLWKLRTEIILGSYFISDFRNTFGFDPVSVQHFFEGYWEYLCDLAQDENPSLNGEQLEPIIESLDNADNLFDWYWSIQDWDWFHYDPEWTEEEEQAYCDYWNGVNQ